jgi:hypothetical protein
VIGLRRWLLGASTEWPDVVRQILRLANLDELAGKYKLLLLTCAQSQRRE